MTERPANGLTYADAGVDIDAGNAMVEAIKPLVRATRRPGADAEIGGFGGLFDLKAAGFKDPVLVAANDGVGTKLKIAIETGRHDTIGIDLVAMCVNDLVVQGAEPLFFLDYFATGKLDPAVGAAVVEGIAEGCRRGRLRADRRRDGRDARHVHGKATMTSPALPSARPSAARCCRAATSRAGDVVLGLASSGLHSNGFSLVRRIVEASGLAWSDPAPFAPGDDARRGAARADPHLRQVDPRRARQDRRHQGARPHHRRRLSGKHPARAARGRGGRASISPPSPCRRCSAGWPGPAASPRPRCCAPSTAASA